MEREQFRKFLTHKLSLTGVWPAALAGISITGVCFALLLACVNPSYTYGTNDNVAIVQMIQADALAPFVDSTYSSLLHLLYTDVSNQVPWYGIWLLCVLEISAALLVGISLYFCRGYLRLLLPFMVIGVYCSSMLRLDYSAVGIMGGFAAVTIGLVLALKGAFTVWRGFLLGMLAMAATWIRLESVAAVAVFSLPLVAVLAVRYLGDEQFRKGLRYLPFLVALVPLAVSSTVDHVHKSRFSSPEFTGYMQWNDLRGEFHSNPIAAANRSNPKVLTATGWSQEDYLSLMKWFFIDESLYNKESMRAFFAVAKSPGVTSYSPDYFLWRFTNLLSVYWIYWLMLAGLILLVCTASMDGLERLIFWCAPVYVFGMIYFIDALLRYPYRVAVPSIGGFIIAYGLVGMAAHDDRPTLRHSFDAIRSSLIMKSRRLLPYSLGLDISAAFSRSVAVLASLAIVAGCTLYVAVGSYEQQAGTQASVFRYNEILTHLNRAYAGRYILIEPGKGLWTQYQSPLTPFVTEFHPIDAGWQTFSPLFYGEIRAFGVDKGRDLPRAMVNTKNAFILAHEKWADLVVDYLHRHADMPAARKEIVEKIDRNLYIYRLVNP